MPSLRLITQTRQVRVSFVRDRRGPCSWLLNLLWFVVAGWHMFMAWFTVGILLCFTIIFFPCGYQVIKIACFLLFPFGKSIEASPAAQGGHCGGCNCCLNIVWMCTVGWMLALQALVTGAVFCLTIVGIPFGWQCFKMASLCFWPFGLEVSSTEMVAETTTITTTTYDQLL